MSILDILRVKKSYLAISLSIILLSSALGSNLGFTQAGAVDSTPSQNGTNLVKQKPMTQDESRHKLTEWQDIVVTLMENNRALGINSVGPDPKSQTLQIGLESLDKERIDAVDSFLVSHQIPLDMVSLVEVKFSQVGDTFPYPSANSHPNSTR